MIRLKLFPTVSAGFISRISSTGVLASKLANIMTRPTVLLKFYLLGSLLFLTSCSSKPHFVPSSSASSSTEKSVHGKLSAQKLKPRGGTTTGPEKVYVLEETENFISLQHLLVMDFVMDGEVHGPFVMKHWRQDWSWQPESFFQFTGNLSWTKRLLSGNESQGKWLQQVFHVDDSPRYSSLGSWGHYAHFSRWVGEQTARPLPRREKTSGLDYSVLVGSNIHTVAKNKWLHEQHNYKCQGTSLDNCQASETGVNSYQRIRGYDFTEGDKYIIRSAPYWKSVREHWRTLFKKHRIIKLKERVENKEQFEKHFENVEKGGEKQWHPATAANTVNSFMDLVN